MSLKTKIAAGLAFMVGAFSIFAGGMAMRGWNPGYSVLSWLPVYNFVMGVLTVLIPALLIWKHHRSALASVIVFLGIHATTTAVLFLAFRATVAVQSLLAMTFRLAVWLIVLGLIYSTRGAKPTS